MSDEEDHGSDSRSLSRLKKEYITIRQGRPFVLYAGLLDLAHQEGLIEIRERLLQIPNDENKNVAVVFTEITMDVNGVKKHFTGIGDACPLNVAPPIVTALIRMASTRSKARALRDAVNIGVTCAEELGNEIAQEDKPVQQKQSVRTSTATQHQQYKERQQETQKPLTIVVPPEEAEKMATDDQVDKLLSKYRSLNLNVPPVIAYGKLNFKEYVRLGKWIKESEVKRKEEDDKPDPFETLGREEQEYINDNEL